MAQQTQAFGLGLAQAVVLVAVLLAVRLTRLLLQDQLLRLLSLAEDKLEALT